MNATKRQNLILGVLSFGFYICYSAPTAAFPLTYNNLNAQVIFNTSQSPAQPNPFTPGDCPDCPFEITNNTGQTWTDFHLDLRPAPGSLGGTFAFINFVAGGYDGDVYEGPGLDALSVDLHSLDITGLNISNGDVLNFNVDIDKFEFIGELELVGFPTTDGQQPPLPEPATFALLGVGCAGLARQLRLAKRRRA